MASVRSWFIMILTNRNILDAQFRNAQGAKRTLLNECYCSAFIEKHGQISKADIKMVDAILILLLSSLSLSLSFSLSLSHYFFWVGPAVIKLFSQMNFRNFGALFSTAFSLFLLLSFSAFYLPIFIFYYIHPLEIGIPTREFDILNLLFSFF